MKSNNKIKDKPIEQFFKLPFEKGTRKLWLSTLESRTDFRAGKNPYFQAHRKFVAFKKGILVMQFKLENEPPVKIYFKVERGYLLISCNVDTDESYLGRYAYRALRSMMWEDHFDFQDYYWPDCFDEKTGKSKYLNIIYDRYGMEISLKENFKGLFRPDDKFLEIAERELLPRLTHIQSSRYSGQNEEIRIGYCFAYTHETKFHSNHYAFLIPYTFIANQDNKSVKSYYEFVFQDTDISDILLYPKQKELNEICFQMKTIAAIAFYNHNDPAEQKEEIRHTNEKHKRELILLWNKALPLLMGESSIHYLYSYGLRNITGKPLKKKMQACRFSMDIPKLNFQLSDKGDYYELSLRFKIGNKVFLFKNFMSSQFLIAGRPEPNTWYLLESEMDSRLVGFFYETDFKIQIPKIYYEECFMDYVTELGKHYELILK
ncbi:hypothetical protein [Pedobacter nototheniae]|uniref:hypothetical protein n=1 Tax=Pedobacter nototheniae TaxID=2488994 RepID=UPI00103D8D08|nr:hypothetical protein [Pedobacter nototheniae]